MVIIAILMLFTGGSDTVTVDHESSIDDLNLYHANMIPLGNGYFGVLTSDTDNIEQTMRIYFFDEKKKDVIFIKEKELSVME
ncbi:hypothetical protein ACFSMW_09135 [Virgibacillus halophilus]|uniref:Uncharacterized protein n=1 Tax=Tigheibacillus halophilus TaxID=361280 RepID=A0ABU5C5E8_9BACI|nr:hypothetical protein [Virgibacillus halophilus]